MVLVEVFASGLPVVASNAGSVPEVLGNGKFGLRVEPGDYKAYAQALIRMLTEDDLREKFIKAARKQAEENYRLDTTVDKIERLRREVTG